MKICFTPESWRDYLFWQQSDQKILKRINELLKAIQRDPYNGIGKPEALKYELSGCYSRRINHEHRLVYLIDEDAIVVISCRYHYQ